MATVRSYTRDFFVNRVWHYEPGQHVSFIGLTGSGKTHTAHQLLARTATQKMPLVDLVMKPRDVTTSRFAKSQRYRIVRDWPLNPADEILRPQKPRGYILWPRHRFDPDVDDTVHNEIFRRGILDSYKRGNRILFADEVVSLTRELNPGLHRELNAVWTKGRSMGTGLWGATQRPRDVPQNMFSAPDHIFLAYDPNKKTIERYGEIGGVSPKIVQAVTEKLPKWWWLYIRRSDRTMCVVLP